MTIAGQSDEIRLVSLVSAKLCHDLLGPLSALSMIAESLEDEDPDTVATSRAMILDSAAKAINRLSFFRAAVGRGQNLGSDEARGLIEKVLAESRVATRWDDTLSAKAGDAAPALLKVALNLAYIGGHTIIGGGAITVQLSGEAAAPRIAVLGNAQRFKLDEAGRAALLAGAKADRTAISGLDPRAVHAYYAGRLAAEQRLSIGVSPPEADHLAIRAEPA